MKSARGLPEEPQQLDQFAVARCICSAVRPFPMDWTPIRVGSPRRTIENALFSTDRSRMRSEAVDVTGARTKVGSQPAFCEADRRLALRRRTLQLGYFDDSGSCRNPRRPARGRDRNHGFRRDRIPNSRLNQAIVRTSFKWSLRSSNLGWLTEFVGLHSSIQHIHVGAARILLNGLPSPMYSEC